MSKDTRASSKAERALMNADPEEGGAFFIVVPPKTGHTHPATTRLVPVIEHGMPTHHVIDIPKIRITEVPVLATKEQTEELRKARKYGRDFRELTAAEVKRRQEQAAEAEKQRKAAAGILDADDLDQQRAAAKAALDEAIRLSGELAKSEEAAAKAQGEADVAAHPAYYEPLEASAQAAEADAKDVDEAAEARREARAEATKLMDEASHPAGNTVAAVAEKGGSAGNYPSVSTVQAAAALLVDKHKLSFDEMKGTNGKLSKAKVQEAAGKVGAVFPDL